MAKLDGGGTRTCKITTCHPPRVLSAANAFIIQSVIDFVSLSEPCTFGKSM
jgi:hypothetical protein